MKPWRAYYDGFGVLVYEDVAPGVVAIVARVEKDRTDEEADGRLLAAAPELLEALKAYVGLGKLCGTCGHWEKYRCEYCEKAEALIARIEGEVTP